jgi:hypothetical protein
MGGLLNSKDAKQQESVESVETCDACRESSVPYLMGSARTISQSHCVRVSQMPQIKDLPLPPRAQWHTCTRLLIMHSSTSKFNRYTDTVAAKAWIVLVPH